jgi:hypothetical protein
VSSSFLLFYMLESQPPGGGLSVKVAECESTGIKNRSVNERKVR